MRHIAVLSLTSAIALSLMGCATSGENWNQERVGSSLFGGSITYTYHKIDTNKYTLEALGYVGLDNTPSADAVVSGYKTRAIKLCLPKSASYEYRMGTWTYMTDLSSVSIPTQAPKVTGIVNCQ